MFDLVEGEWVIFSISMMFGDICLCFNDQHCVNTYSSVYKETTKQPTCTASGLRAQRCSVCGETLSAETIPAPGHSPAEWSVTREATCLQSGLRQKLCSVCGAVLESEQLDALGHSYTEWEIITEATKEHEGEQTRHCVNCGDTQFEKIPKVEKFLGIF